MRLSQFTAQASGQDVVGNRGEAGFSRAPHCAFGQKCPGMGLPSGVSSEIVLCG